MTQINYHKVAPDAMKAMMGLEEYVKKCGLEPSLLHLIKVRASQINGCAYCVDLHTKEARKDGESEQRLYALVVWKDSSLFDERERAVLAWTDAITLISETHAPLELRQAVLKHFSEKATVDLTMAIVTINCWNRIAISFKKG